ncbi:MAG: NAD-dependent epimerase/dehydratase family protein, partial [Symploca sp. SIO2D2]|nr:NAD-dependent epimerase/dehydratase family protein [Symploca sp. SIO2D2]
MKKSHKINNLKIFQLQIANATNYQKENNVNSIDLSSEVVLDSSIKPQHSYHFTKPKSIFITGVTGFVGAFLLQELLNQTSADIYCLVRSPNANFGKMRIKKNLESYGIWDESLSNRIIPISGNLSKPLFGLSNEEFDTIASQIDVIYHSAARLTYIANYSQLKAINVLGTQEILRLACHIKVKPVHYLSTVAVFESSAYYGKKLKEDDPLIHSKDIYLGYSQSKWVAEKIVTLARDRGLPVCIYRPPLISGHSETGVWNTEDITCKLIKGCFELGYAPDLDFIFELSPVDYIVKSIVCLSQQKKLLGQAFNLNNPNTIHSRGLVNLCQSFGYAVQLIPYEQWLLKLGDETTNNKPNTLAPLLPFFRSRWSENKITIPQIYENTKRSYLDCQNTLNILAKSGIQCPALDFKLMTIYILYFINSGFLKLPKRVRLPLPSYLTAQKLSLFTEKQVQEFCTGSISKCFGEEFAIYDDGGKVKISRMPNTHLNLVSRVLEVKGKCHQIKRGSSIIAEYDVPINPWYYRQNSSATVPYSILMEIALQPCGFLSAYLGTTLLYPNQSFYFRNLDGCGIIFKDIDIQGKTITNTSTLISTSNIQGMILQSFNFQLVYDEEIFYQGEASFGHFSPEVLANQVGLDLGKNVLPWYKKENTLKLPEIDLNLLTQESRNKYYKINPNQPHYCLAQHQLDLLNEVKIIAKGGKYQKGYIYARKDIKPTDWYFKCHFYQDPVMPGSLGVEAMLQAM